MTRRVWRLVAATIPSNGLDAFDEYEAAVLPLLGDHDGRLEWRVRSPDRMLEVHLVSFPDSTALASFFDDQRRLVHRSLLESSGASITVTEVTPVD